MKRNPSHPFNHTHIHLHYLHLTRHLSYWIPFLKMCILSLDSSTLPSASMTPGNASRAVGISGEHHSVSTAAVLGRSWGGWALSRQPAVSCDALHSSSFMLCLPRKNVVWDEQCLWTEPRHTNKQKSFSTQTVEPGVSHPALRTGASLGLTNEREEGEEGVEGWGNLNGTFCLDLPGYVQHSPDQICQSYDWIIRVRTRPPGGKQSPRCRSSQWTGEQLSRHLVAPAALGSHRSPPNFLVQQQWPGVAYQLPLSSAEPHRRL